MRMPNKLEAVVGERARRSWNISLGWLASHATCPEWLPLPLRLPSVSYGIAVAATALTGGLLALVSATTAGSVQSAAPLLLVDVLVALAFGPGPSLLAALLGTFMLDYLIYPPHFAWAHTDPGKAISIGIFGLVGCAISLLASRVERARAQKEALAEALRASEQETVRRMDEFLGVASHELKTPLTSLLANVQLAKRKLRAQETEPEADALEQRQGHITQAAMLLDNAERQARRQNRLINDLLEMSRARADKLRLALGITNLATIVREGVEEQRRTHPERQIGLQIVLPAGMASIPVEVDADRIGQVLANYLSNALKYSPVEAPVHITLSLESATTGGGHQWARVAVEDAGPGLPPDEQVRVWERFHRVPGVEVQSGSGIGLGLGLYISREIVQRHGGHIGVESIVGKGSTFWFALPLATTLA